MVDRLVDADGKEEGRRGDEDESAAGLDVAEGGGRGAEAHMAAAMA